MAIETNTSYWVNAFHTRLDGEYKLQDLVSADADSAIFRTTSLEIARFFQLTARDAAHQVDLWQSIAHSAHPNLLRVISYGHANLDGQPGAYVISEAADESLVPVLRERKLTQEETQGLLQSMTAALNHLHARGFVHGRVCPAEVFASGETIKISSDCVKPIGEKSGAYRSFPAYVAPEQQGQNTTPAADVWCLGATLFEVLTQRPFAMERRGDIARLPAPLNRVVEGCLAADPAVRPRVSELLSSGQDKVAPQPPVVVASADVVEPPFQSAAPSFMSGGAAPEGSSRRTPLMVAAAAVVVLLLVASVWWAKNRVVAREDSKAPDAKVVNQQAVADPETPAAQTNVPAAAQTSVPAAAKTNEAPAANKPPAASEPVAASEGKRDAEPAPVHAPVATAAQETPSRSAAPLKAGDPVWRVILWTYADEGMAKSKADQLAQKHPELNPEVFTPDTNGGGLHLVVVGGAMTRDQAQDLEHKVRQLGLPRDAYVQNFRR